VAVPPVEREGAEGASARFVGRANPQDQIDCHEKRSENAFDEYAVD